MTGLLLLSTLLTAVALAGADMPPDPDKWIWSREILRENQTLAAAQKMGRTMFATIDGEGDGDGGVSEFDYVLGEHRALAKQRTGLISRWSRNDLDGDGAVTRAELEAALSRAAQRPIQSSGVEIAPTPAQVERVLGELVARHLEADRNSDDRVTFAEALAAAHAVLPNPGQRYKRQIPSSLDRDGDARVTPAELSVAIEAAFARVDSDGDGQLSYPEFERFEERAFEARRRALLEAMGK